MIHTSTQGMPCIVVCLSQDFAYPEVLREILSGIEEESIPYRVVQDDTAQGVSLAFKAAELSPLDVGIGADGSGCVAVHYRQLPPSAPLFRLDYRMDLPKVRSACSNAARLVKGTPFKMQD